MQIYNVATGDEQQPRDEPAEAKTSGHCSDNADEDVHVLSSDTDSDYEGMFYS